MSDTGTSASSGSSFVSGLSRSLKVDILINPHSVARENNVGRIKECLVSCEGWTFVDIDGTEFFYPYDEQAYHVSPAGAEGGSLGRQGGFHGSRVTQGESGQEGSAAVQPNSVG